jgi:hypothetical protein
MACERKSLACVVRESWKRLPFPPKKLVTLDRELFGNTHAELAVSLQLLAELQGLCGAFPAAREAAKERLRIRTALHGDQDWRAIDARVALDSLEQLARLTAEQRRQVAEAAREDAEAGALNERGDIRASARHTLTSKDSPFT